MRKLKLKRQNLNCIYVSMICEDEEALVPGDEDETGHSDVEPEEENPGFEFMIDKSDIDNDDLYFVGSGISEPISDDEHIPLECDSASSPVISKVKKVKKDSRSSPSIRSSSPMKLSINIKRKTSNALALRRSSADSSDRKTRKKLSMEQNSQIVSMSLFPQFKQVCS